MNPLINPLARNGKFGWYNTFRKHVTMSTSSSSAKLVLIGDSTNAGIILPALVEYVIIHCGTSNLGHNSPIKIAGLINIACILKKNYKNLQIFVSCLLPRDDEKSVKRSLLYAVNW